jgi:hypothetical protein
MVFNPYYFRGTKFYTRYMRPLAHARTRAHTYLYLPHALIDHPYIYITLIDHP